VGESETQIHEKVIYCSFLWTIQPQSGTEFKLFLLRDVSATLICLLHHQHKVALPTAMHCPPARRNGSHLRFTRQSIIKLIKQTNSAKRQIKQHKTHCCQGRNVTPGADAEKLLHSQSAVLAKARKRYWKLMAIWSTR